MHHGIRTVYKYALATLSRPHICTKHGCYSGVICNAGFYHTWEELSPPPLGVAEDRKQRLLSYYFRRRMHGWMDDFLPAVAVVVSGTCRHNMAKLISRTEQNLCGTIGEEVKRSEMYL